MKHFIKRLILEELNKQLDRIETLKKEKRETNFDLISYVEGVHDGLQKSLEIINRIVVKKT